MEVILYILFQFQKERYYSDEQIQPSHKFSPATKKLVAFVIIAAMLCMFAPEGFLTGRDAFAASKTVTSISIKSKPSKLKYKVGNKLSTKGLKLTVKYKGGSKATISSGFTCTPTKLSKAGTQKITVKYKGKKTSFNVTVSKVVKSIKIKAKPAKLKYKTGEKLNTKGLKSPPRQSPAASPAPPPNSPRPAHRRSQ